MASNARRRSDWRKLAVTAAVLASLLQLAGCVTVDLPDEDISEPEVPVQKPSETPVPVPVPPSQIVIIDMHEEAAAEPSLVRVSGTIVNHGKTDAVRVTVRLEARDANGRVLTRVTTPALEQTIPANGGTSLFEVTMPRSGSIHDYHADIISH